VNLQAADVTGLELQVGDDVRAFYHGGDDVDDIVVDYAPQRSTRESILPFVAEDDAYLPGGSFGATLTCSTAKRSCAC